MVAVVDPALDVLGAHAVGKRRGRALGFRRELHGDGELGQHHILVHAALPGDAERAQQTAAHRALARHLVDRDLDELPRSRQLGRDGIEHDVHAHAARVGIDPRIERVGDEPAHQGGAAPAQDPDDLAVRVLHERPAPATGAAVDEDLVPVDRRGELVGRDHDVGQVALALPDDPEPAGGQPQLADVVVRVLHRDHAALRAHDLAALLGLGQQRRQLAASDVLSQGGREAALELRHRDAIPPRRPDLGDDFSTVHCDPPRR